MNDFTKDELTAIRDECRGIYVDGNIIEPIIVKLKTMIDNYCEHNETMEIEAPSDLCKKCNKVLSKEWI